MTYEHELARLQERLDAARKTQIVGPDTAQPVAVSINGGPLVYGEVRIEVEDEVTYFARPFDRVILRRSWHVEVELARPFRDYLEHAHLRMGDTKSQPYEGTAHMVDQRAELGIPHIRARFQGVGELIKRLGESTVQS